MYRTARRDRRKSLGNIVAGGAAGVIGGLAGALVMNQVSPALEMLRRLAGRSAGDDAPEAPSPRAQGRSGGEAGAEDNVSATVKVAQIVSRTVAGREIARDLGPRAGNVIHYAFGALNGVVYGALAVVAPGVTMGRGLLFGAALWATADETMLPLLGLSKPPTRYPASTHALALAGHLAFGLTVDAVHRAVRGWSGR